MVICGHSLCMNEATVRCQTCERLFCQAHAARSEAGVDECVYCREVRSAIHRQERAATRHALAVSTAVGLCLGLGVAVASQGTIEWLAGLTTSGALLGMVFGLVWRL